MEGEGEKSHGSTAVLLESLCFAQGGVYGSAGMPLNSATLERNIYISVDL